MRILLTILFVCYACAAHRGRGRRGPKGPPRIPRSVCQGSFYRQLAEEQRENYTKECDAIETSFEEAMEGLQEDKQKIWDMEDKDEAKTAWKAMVEKTHASKKAFEDALKALTVKFMTPEQKAKHEKHEKYMADVKANREATKEAFEELSAAREAEEPDEELLESIEAKIKELFAAGKALHKARMIEKRAEMQKKIMDKAQQRKGRYSGKSARSKDKSEDEQSSPKPQKPTVEAKEKESRDEKEESSAKPRPSDEVKGRGPKKPKFHPKPKGHFKQNRHFGRKG